MELLDNALKDIKNTSLWSYLDSLSIAYSALYMFITHISMYIYSQQNKFELRKLDKLPTLYTT